MILKLKTLLILGLFAFSFACSDKDTGNLLNVSDFTGTYLSNQINTASINDTSAVNESVAQLFKIEKDDDTGISVYLLCNPSSSEPLYKGTWQTDGKQGWNLVPQTKDETHSDDNASAWQLNITDHNMLKMVNSTSPDAEYKMVKSSLTCSDLTNTANESVALLQSDVDEDCADWGNGDGRKNLLCAGNYQLNMNLQSDTTQGDTEQTVTNTGDTEALLCESLPIEETGNQTFAGSFAASYDPNMFPGAIFYGQDFANGTGVSPIATSTPRDGATFSVGIMSLYNNQFTVDEVTAGNIQNALQQEIFTEDNIKQTTANTDFTMTQVYSSEQLAIDANVSVTVGTSGSGTLDFTWNSSTDKNYFLIRYTQIYYSVTMNPPGTPWSVFQTDENGDFTDEANRFVKNNPPGIFLSVSYGRQLYLKIETTLTETEVNSALGIEVNSGDTEVKVDISVDYASALNESTIQASTLGGNASDNTALLNAVTSASGETKITDIITAVNAWIDAGDTFNADDGDVYMPVTFNANYLNDNTVMSKGFSLSYTQQDCTIIPQDYAEFRFVLDSVDSKLFYYLDNSDDTEDTESFVSEYKDASDATGQFSSATSVFEATGTIPGNSQFYDSNDHIVRLQVRNDSCGNYSFKGELQRRWEDSTTTPGTTTTTDWQTIHQVDAGPSFSNCSWVYRQSYRINRSTGEWSSIDQSTDAPWW